jgi:hypothetical protein
LRLGAHIDSGQRPRHRVDPASKRPGHPGSGLRRREPQEWLARIEGALPAYISIEQYQANLERLAANRPHADVPGAVRFGPALLAGLLRCGRCRRRMTVSYHVDAGKPRTAYNCTGARAEYGGPNCQNLSGRCLDQTVTALVLAALANDSQETYPPHRWILHADPTELTALRAHLNRVRGRTTRIHPRFATTPTTGQDQP